MKTNLRDYLHFFGYAKHPKIQSDTQFYDFYDQTEEDLYNYDRFHELNNQAICNPIDLSKRQTWDVHGGTAETSLIAMGWILSQQKE